MTEQYGPFDTYTENMTSHGVFGLKAGEILTFVDGAAFVAEADDEDAVQDPNAAADDEQE